MVHSLLQVHLIPLLGNAILFIKLLVYQIRSHSLKDLLQKLETFP